MTYSKADVEFHSERYERRPAVNIKCNLWESGESGDFTTAVLTEAAELAGYEAEGFISWWREMAENDEDAFDRMIYNFRDFAAESAFEYAQSDAEDIFGDDVKVFSEGRQGGWLVVHGLADFESWDAIMLSRWAKFEKIVKNMVKGFAVRVAELIAMNAYEAHLADVAAEERFEQVGKWEEKFKGTPLQGMVFA